MRTCNRDTGKLADYRQINGFLWLFGVKAIFFTKVKKRRLNRVQQTLKTEGSAVILLGGHRAGKQLGAAIGGSGARMRLRALNGTEEARSSDG